MEPAVAQETKGWERRRLAGAAVRVGVTLAPAIVSAIAAEKQPKADDGLKPEPAPKPRG